MCQVCYSGCVVFTVFQAGIHNSPLLLTLFSNSDSVEEQLDSDCWSPSPLTERPNMTSSRGCPPTATCSTNTTWDPAKWWGSVSLLSLSTPVSLSVSCLRLSVSLSVSCLYLSVFLSVSLSLCQSPVSICLSLCVCLLSLCQSPVSLSVDPFFLHLAACDTAPHQAKNRDLLESLLNCRVTES